jgi:hypothetical protein
MAYFMIKEDLVETGLAGKIFYPPLITAAIASRSIKEKGCKFKIRDADGIVYYTGSVVLDGDDSGFEPLDYLGPNVGATNIEYFGSKSAANNMTGIL